MRAVDFFPTSKQVAAAECDRAGAATLAAQVAAIHRHMAAVRSATWLAGRMVELSAAARARGVA